MSFLIAVHIIVIVLLVLLVLLQSGKGAEIGATFGGSSQTLFGSSGAGNFLQKFTIALAAIFMMTSIGITVYKNKTVKQSLFDSGVPAQSAPVTAAPQDASPQNTEKKETESK